MMDNRPSYETAVDSNGNLLFTSSVSDSGYAMDRIPTIVPTSDPRYSSVNPETRRGGQPVTSSAYAVDYSHVYSSNRCGETCFQSIQDSSQNLSTRANTDPPVSSAPSSSRVAPQYPVSNDCNSFPVDPPPVPVTDCQAFAVNMNEKLDTAHQSTYPGSMRTRTSHRTAANPAQPKSNLKMPVRSTGPEHSKAQLKRSSRPRQSASNAAQNQSLASENALPEQTDPFQQWYQMMSEYYRQFYPGYQLPQPSSSHFQTTAVPVSSTPPTHPQSIASTRQQPMYPAPNAVAPGSLDYLSYYYQYYYGANATSFWPGHSYSVPDPTGRMTPKLFPTPHIKALLSSPGLLVQVLPNRPLDGELARVELVDLSELATQAVAEATKRMSDTGNISNNLTRLTELSLCRDSENFHDGFSSGASGVDSPGRLSSVQVVGGGDDEAEEVRAYAAIAMAWDRTDHLLYPGPLSRSDTLKADVLAFLREKLAEIQDRLPIDWESAGLLITYLESLVKNNGNIQPGDLVNLLLEGHEPQTSDLRMRGLNRSGGSGSHIGLSFSQNQLMRNKSYLNDSLASLPPSQPPSGRQSPQVPYAMMGQSSSRAASDAGGLSSTQALLRKAAAAAANMLSETHGGDTEDQTLDRFRELLMHGMTMKALEHACRTRLWGHAFVLAQRLGTPIFDKVMERFINRAVAITDPILTLYQLTAGEMPQAVTAAAYGRGADNGEWRPHLAMILAAESAQPELINSALDRLGDGLLSRHLVYAAHLCYLLMGPQYKQTKSNRGPVYCLPDKIWLLGVSSSPGDTSNKPESNASETKHPDPSSYLKVASEAIQLTEVYEYAMKLANRNYRLPQLLPLKLLYATRLIDAGLLDKANRYLSAIGTDILLEASNQDITDDSLQFPILYSLVTNCLRLAEPLRNYSEFDGFDSHLIGSAPRHSRFSGFTDGPSLSSSGSNADWLERLRDLHRLMDKHLGRSGYVKVDSKPQPSVSSPNLPHVPATVNYSQAYTAPAQSQPSYGLNPTQTPATCAQFQTYQSSYRSPSNQPKEEPPESPKSNKISLGHGHSDQLETWRSSSIDFHQPSDMDNSSVNRTAAAYHISDQSRSSVQPLSSHLPEHAKASMVPFGQNAQNADFFIHNMNYSAQMNAVHRAPADPSNTIDSPDSKTPTTFHETQSAFTFQNVNTSPRSTQAQLDYLSPTLDRTHASSGSGHVPEDSSVSSGRSQDTSIHFPSQPQSPDGSTRFPKPTPISADQPVPYNMFFTPTTLSSQADVSASGGSAVFDYFAGLQHQSTEETGNRSRTVSGGSQCSPVEPYASMTQAPVKAPIAPRSRLAGGHYSPRRNSRTPERPFLPQVQQPQAATQSMNHPNEMKKPIDEEPKYDDQQHRESGQDSNQSREGWFSGWFGKRKKNGAKSVYLPDDSKPSIVWDDQLKQWIDTNNPEAREPTPPPPPAISNSVNVSTYSPRVDDTLPTHNRTTGRTNNRSRYVNVFANQTYGSAASKADAPLQPPLPPTVFAARPSDSLQDRLLNEHNMRPSHFSTPMSPNDSNVSR